MQRPIVAASREAGVGEKTAWFLRAFVPLLSTISPTSKRHKHPSRERDLGATTIDKENKGTNLTALDRKLHANART